MKRETNTRLRARVRGDAPLRVLIVTEHFWPEAFRIDDLAYGLVERGHHVEVVTGLPNYPEGRFFPGYGLGGPYRERRDGVEIHRVPIVPRQRGRAWHLALNYLSFVLAAAVRLAFASDRWDAVLVFQPTPVTTILPALILRARGVPLYCWVQDLWPDTLEASGVVRSKRLLAWTGALSRWLYRRCDHILLQSEAYRARMHEMGVSGERVEYLPNWADDGVAQPTGEPAGLDHEDVFTVVFAGNLGRVQALGTLVEAASLVRARGLRCRWVFAGDGAMREWLEMQVHERSLADVVTLLGRRPSSEMPALFRRAGALVVSLSDDPVLAMTVPSKLQSYLAAGRPVLGSLNGEGARVLMESGAGYVSAAQDSAALAENVARMISLPPEDRAGLGRSGREYYARHFTREACLDALERTLDPKCARGDE